MNEPEIRFRLIVVDPPAGVLFALQRGRSDVEQVQRSAGFSIAFEFALRVRSTNPDGSANFVGAFAQGPPSGRFFYINSGTYAGDISAGWGRRAKVPLTAIGNDLVSSVAERPGSVLEARIGGTAKDGGPACASVRLLAGGWQIAG